MNRLRRFLKAQILVFGLVAAFAGHQYLIKVSVDLKHRNVIHQTVVTYSVALLMAFGMLIARLVYVQLVRRARRGAPCRRTKRRSQLAKLAGLFVFLFKKGKFKDKWFLVWSTALGTMSVALTYKLQGNLTPGLGSYLNAVPWVLPVYWILHRKPCTLPEALLMALGMLAVIVTGQLRSADREWGTLILSVGLLCLISILFVFQDNRIRTFTKEQGPLSIEVIRKSVSMITLLLVFTVNSFFSEDRFEFTLSEYAALIARGVVGTILAFLVLLGNSNLGMIKTDVIKRLGQLVGLVTLIAFTGGENLQWLVPIVAFYLFVLVALMRRKEQQSRF